MVGTIEPRGGRFPEQEGNSQSGELVTAGFEERGKRLHGLQRTIGLQVCDFMSFFNPDNPFELVNADNRYGSVIREAILSSMRLTDLPGDMHYNESYKKEYDYLISQFINDHSNPSFKEGIRGIRNLMVGLRKYLAGEEEPKPTTQNNQIYLEPFSINANVLVARLRHDPTGLSLMQPARNDSWSNYTPARRAGVEFDLRRITIANAKFTDDHFEEINEILGITTGRLSTNPFLRGIDNLTEQLAPPAVNRATLEMFKDL